MSPPGPSGASGEATQNQAEQQTSILAVNEDEQYNSEEDSDFDINNPTKDEDESDAGVDSDAGEEPETDARARKRRRVADADDQGGDGFVMGELESGDEVTIQEGKERRKRTKKKGKKSKSARGKSGGGDRDGEEGEESDFDDDDDAGGEGGFVRTRGMKMRMEEERRPLANADGSTIDVDALWAQMNTPTAAGIGPQKDLDDKAGDSDNGVVMADGEKGATPAKDGPRPGEEMVTIKRTYKFAGEVITEEKTVPKESAEARLYFASRKKNDAGSANSTENLEDTDSAPRLRRPLRRISRFDPNPPDAIKKSWEKQNAVAGAGAAPKGPKLNTVMKSKLDWATYVDREGIKDELDVHSKAKDSYLNRADFLGRMEERQEEERRNARLRNMG